MITGRNPPIAKTATSFDDALEFFEETTRNYADLQILYRGQAATCWEVIPSLFRQSPDISNYEAELVRELVSLFPNEFLSDQTMFDRLVRMQHYGLPTRLLDTTSNPLVALYFAVDPDNFVDENGSVIMFAGKPNRHKFYDSDTVSCMSHLANLNSDERETLANTSASTISDFNKLLPADRLIQFIKSEKPYFLPKIKKVDLFRPISVTPKRSNVRIAAQAGKFILFGLESRTGPKYPRDNRMIKMDIEKNAKHGILERLGRLSIDGSTLFPEIDRSAARITQLYKQKASTTII